MNTIDERFMLTALKLAKKGIGSVEPNPPVGAVLVKSGKIIGRGYHKKFGEPHAEINALDDCIKKGNDPKGSTLYVTLEPCCHFGKTPPCTDKIIENRIAKVFIAMLDESEHACGRGVKKLKEAGIEVVTGLCEKQARILNAPFIKFVRTGRCWVILKWAQSIDGKLAFVGQGKGKNRKWISNEKSRKDAHKLRRRVDAILVGVNTIIADDPLLTARPGRAKKPLRIILDTGLKTPPDCRLLNTADKIPLLIVTNEKAITKNPEKVRQFEKKGVGFLTAPVDKGKCDLDFVIGQLKNYGIYRLLVEGGPTIIASFLSAGLADEVIVYIAPTILGGRGSTSINECLNDLAGKIDLHYVDIKSFDDDIRIKALLNKVD